MDTGAHTNRKERSGCMLTMPQIDPEDSRWRVKSAARTALIKSIAHHKCNGDGRVARNEYSTSAKATSLRTAEIHGASLRAKKLDGALPTPVNTTFHQFPTKNIQSRWVGKLKWDERRSPGGVRFVFLPAREEKDRIHKVQQS